MKIVIVGGGIVGMTLAYYLSKTNNAITLIDDGNGQATKNAVGIICPWLSQRRNKKWLNLVHEGALFYNQLKIDLASDNVVLPLYNNGTVAFKKNDKIIQSIINNINKNQFNLTIQNNLSVPEIALDLPNIFCAEGSYLDGKEYLERLKTYLLPKVTFINNKCVFKNDQLLCHNEIIEYDKVIFCCGAWINETLPDYHVAVYPQKGQLLEISTNHQQSISTLMLANEIDILPKNDGTFVVGATHENDMAFDLSIDMNKINDMYQLATSTLPLLKSFPITNIRVGTRAYTTDFQPFFGQLTQNIYVASGLGSSGLTSGPIIAYLLSRLILNQNIDFPIEDYSPKQYITKI